MEIDFTKLNKLAVRDSVEGATEKQPSTSHLEPFSAILAGMEYKAPKEDKKPLELNTEGLEGIRTLQREADRKKQDIDHSLQVYKEYQQNIKTSSQLQTEILKGARAGENIYILFLKAVKAISLMTSNQLFYNQLEGDIRVIYGIGLQEALAIDVELEQVTERYIKLMIALEQEPDKDNRERIKQAIEAHEKKMRELEAFKKGKKSKAS